LKNYLARKINARNCISDC